MNYSVLTTTQILEKSNNSFKKYLISSDALLNIKLNNVIVGIEFVIYHHFHTNIHDEEYFYINCSKWMNPFYKNDKTVIKHGIYEYKIVDNYIFISRKEGINISDMVVNIKENDKIIYKEPMMKLMIKYNNVIYPIYIGIYTFLIYDIANKVNIIEIFTKELYKAYPKYFNNMYVIIKKVHVILYKVIEDFTKYNYTRYNNNITFKFGDESYSYYIIRNTIYKDLCVCCDNVEDEIVKHNKLFN